MSINWVMVSPHATPPWTPLPHERPVYASSPRVRLEIKSPEHFPGKKQPTYHLKHENGTLWLTNQRMVYLPDKPTEHFKSFSCPILRLHDSHVSIPMFSPHTWSAAMQPVQGGNIPTPSTGVVEVKLAFKDGGAHDMQAQYEQIRERIQQAVEVSGSGSSGADVSNVNLEDLPAYQEESDGPLISATTAAVVQQSVPTAQQQLEGNVAGVEAVNGGTRAMVSDTTLNHPDEPPPGYEETQMAGLQSEAERRLNGQE